MSRLRENKRAVFCTSRKESGQSGEQSPGHVQQGSPATRRPEECGEAGETSRPFHLYVLFSLKPKGRFIWTRFILWVKLLWASLISTSCRVAVRVSGKWCAFLHVLSIQPSFWHLTMIPSAYSYRGVDWNSTSRCAGLRGHQGPHE